MHVYHDLKDKLCKELTELTQNRDITNASLDQIDKLTHSIKSLATIIAMEDSGYSEMDGYEDGRGGNSYARGRSMRTGRYISREGGNSGRGYSSRYSREGTDREQVAQQLDQMMEDAPDEQVRNQIRRIASDIRGSMNN